ncbi:MAG: VRR-NUC domain-containing protein [Ruminococcus sp.]|nr:VRR-NUC domain-containing protein [Ruminococcus sp.]
MKQEEAIEQSKVISYCTLRGYPVFHIPNGGKRNRKEAYYLKQQGVKAGVPDLCFPVALRGYHGLFIEMKAGKNKTTDNQDAWLELLARNGYCVRVCYGFMEAMSVIDWYFEEVRHV